MLNKDILNRLKELHLASMANELEKQMGKRSTRHRLALLPHKCYT